MIGNARSRYPIRFSHNKKLNTPGVQNRKRVSLPDVTQSQLILRICSGVTICVSSLLMYSFIQHVTEFMDSIESARARKGRKTLTILNM